MKSILRKEIASDYRAVEELTREALFWNRNVPGCHEHYFVHTMRAHPDYLPDLSNVLEADGRIVGSIHYTPARLTDETGRKKRSWPLAR